MVKSINLVAVERFTPEQFVQKAIRALRTEKSKGIHVVRSGFNQAFRDYFDGKIDPVETTTQMRKEGKLAVFLTRGGVVIYLREDLKESTLIRHDAEWKERDKKEPPAKSTMQPTTSGQSSDVLTKILGN